MAKLDEIIYSIHRIIERQISDDTSLSERETIFHINTQRALHVRNELNRNRSIDPELIQSLGCVEVEFVDRSECLKCGIETGCDVMRTKEKIPSLVELHDRIPIQSISYNNVLAPTFNVKTSFEQLKYVGHGRFNKNQVFVGIKDQYIYIISNNPEARFLEHISVNGVFENPLEVAKFKDCSDKPCFDRLTMDYPVKSWMLPRIRQFVIEEYGRKLSLPIDITNNATDDKQGANEE